MVGRPWTAPSKGCNKSKHNALLFTSNINERVSDISIFNGNAYNHTLKPKVPFAVFWNRLQNDQPYMGHTNSRRQLNPRRDKFEIFPGTHEEGLSSVTMHSPDGTRGTWAPAAGMVDRRCGHKAVS